MYSRFTCWKLLSAFSAISFLACRWNFLICDTSSLGGHWIREQYIVYGCGFYIHAELLGELDTQSAWLVCFYVAWFSAKAGLLFVVGKKRVLCALYPVGIPSIKAFTIYGLTNAFIAEKLVDFFLSQNSLSGLIQLLEGLVKGLLSSVVLLKLTRIQICFEKWLNWASFKIGSPCMWVNTLLIHHGDTSEHSSLNREKWNILR